MGVRRPWFALAVLLIPVGARAGHHKFDAFVAPSYLRAKGSTINLGGWHVSGAATLGEKHTWLSLIGDVSVHFLGGDGTDPTTARTQVTLMAGPRFTVKDGHGLRNLFGHIVVLGAVQRAGAKEFGQITAAAFAIGAGKDFPLWGEEKSWGMRFQVDYIQPLSSDLGGGFRISVGAVYQWHFD